jgi:hypothetical protein
MNDKLPSNKHDNNNGHKARGTSRHKWLDGGSGAQGDKEPAPLRISAGLTIPLLVRGALLAQGIPALTPPTGATAFGNEFYDDKMINLNDTLKIERPNAWPDRKKYPGHWCHSDLKDVAYFFNFKFYEKAIEKGNLR